jgi:pyruvyl transferase EpsO
VPSSQPFALLDFPHHPNVGDSAIWLGEIEYFRRFHDQAPAYVCHLGSASWDALERAMPEGPIFIHGGGNFGDIWKHHHSFREAVLERFRDRPIVQLPQTIHFSGQEALRRTAGLIRSHPNVTLLARDARSLAFAREHFECESHLCPDMAFCVGPLRKPVPPSHPLFVLARSDSERADSGPGELPLPPGAARADWLEEDPQLEWKIRRRTMVELIPTLGLRAFDRWRRRELLYRRLAENRLARGLRLLSSGRAVIADRLHAHILCLLLDQPHILLDNNYGKNSSFVETWTKDCDILRFESNLEAALASAAAGQDAGALSG